MDKRPQYQMRSMAPYGRRMNVYYTLFLLCTAFNLSGQTLSIEEAVRQGLGATVQVEGIILNSPNERDLRFIQDSTGGLPIYVTDDAFNQNVRTGDRIQIRAQLDAFNGLVELNNIQEYEIVKVNQSLPELQSFSKNKLSVRVAVSCLRDEAFVINEKWKSGSHPVLWNVYESEAWIPQNSVLAQIEKERPVLSAEAIVYKDNDGYHFLLQNISYPSDPPCVFWKERPLLVNAGIDFLQFDFSLYESAHARAFVKHEDLRIDTITGRMDSVHSIILPGLNPASFYQVTWQTFTENDTLTDSTGLFITQSLSSKNIKAYFNQPLQYDVTADHKYFTRGIDLVNEIVDRIESARESIDVCLYNFNNQDIKSALEAAKDRGIRVRCIADGDNSNIGFRNTSLNVFRTAYGRPLMHNKFIIVDAGIADNAWLFMGATNLTPGQIFNDPNSALGIEDQMLARVYQIEFEEIWGSSGPNFDPEQGRHGAAKFDNTPHDMFMGTAFVESRFSPSDGTTQAIKDALASAKQEVYFSLLTFTKNELREQLIELHNRGVNVKGIIENVDDTGGEYYRLNNAGIEVLDDTKGRIHHHKYAIVDPFDTDNAKLITGSHNWTQKAEDTNDENTLIIHDAELAQIFLSEFQARWCEYKMSDAICRIDTTDTPVPISVKLSPNPAKASELGIFLNAAASNRFNIFVYDLQGRAIISMAKELDPGNNQLPELSLLVPGMYILQMINEEKEFQLRSIITE